MQADRRMGASGDHGGARPKGRSHTRALLLVLAGTAASGVAAFTPACAGRIVTTDENGGSGTGAGGQYGRPSSSSHAAGGSSVGGATLGGASVLGSSGSTTQPPSGSSALGTSPATGSQTFATKVDLLFDIDNSPSMGDKQAYLVQAIPDLIDRLLNPNCVDQNGDLVLDGNGDPVASVNGQCPQGDGVEFTPVSDMHVGIVTSSLGSRLSDQPLARNGTITICDPTAPPTAPFGNIPAHTDDQGHLIARSLTYTNAGTPSETATEGTVEDAVVPSYAPAPGGFLDWFPGAPNVAAPPTPAGLSPVASATALTSDFGAIVQGAGVYGCGIESQLESWYRFLIQPDPYASLQADSDGRAIWSGVDTTLLQERADFLRPDSLVGIVVLTDENDSEIDVRSLDGEGYLFMGQGWEPLRGTSACATNPGSANCTNCSDVSDPSSDPACSPETYTAENDWGFDLNLRHAHMKQKYGLDPQYPWQRYVVGLTQTAVPDRIGEYPSGASNYVGVSDCTNPLFASELPSGSVLTGATLTSSTLCNLPQGQRNGNLVFYTIIGGVPNQLLHFDPNSASNSALTPSDWTRILGRGPAGEGLTDSPSYDYTGIDPHMIESYQDRTTLPAYQHADLSGTNPLASASSDGNSDPVSGREWTTDEPYISTPAPGSVPYAPHILPVDLQYACIFELPAPRDCSAAQIENGYQCDCPGTAQGLTPDEVPPVCNRSNATEQDYAKAYPTIRELQVARLLGNQGVVASLCPIDVNDNAAGNDPLYGYRPAFTALVDRMKPSLRTAPPCLCR